MSRRLNVDRSSFDRLRRQVHLLAQPTRLRILLALADGTSRVERLSARTGIKKAMVLWHLKRLWQAGIVEKKPRLRQWRYELSDAIEIKRTGRSLTITIRTQSGVSLKVSVPAREK